MEINYPTLVVGAFILMIGATIVFPDHKDDNS